MGTGTAKAKASAFDASGLSIDDAPALEAALQELRDRYEAGAPARREEAAAAAVDKAKDALVAAEYGLEQVRRENAERAAEDEAGRIAKAERHAAVEAAALAAEDAEGEPAPEVTEG